MKFLWTVGLAAAVGIACGGGGEEAKSGGGGAAAAALATSVDGAKIYKTRCVTCHGSKGDMGANGAANLQMSKISLAERVATVTHGRMDKGMQAFKGILSPEEIDAVAEYTMTLSKG